MLFGDIALGARLERAEARLVADSVEAGARRRGDAEAFAIPLAGGVAGYSLPGSPLNKVAGLGFGGPLDAGALAAVEEEYARRGCPVQVELSSLADPSVAALLADRGYRFEGVENVLGRTLPVDGPDEPATGIEVAVSPPPELPVWLDVVTTGFAHGDEQGVPSAESFPRELLETVMTDMAGAEGFVRSLARRDGQVAGGASLRQHGGVAILCGAATLPDHRRRGVQRALLLARLRASAEAGCDLALVTTQPGSKSQQNVQRLGFALLYTRAVLVLPPA